MNYKLNNYKITSYVIIFIILFVGCKDSQKSLRTDIINAKNSVLYLESENEGSLNGKVVLFDLDKNKAIEIRSNINNNSNPRLTPNKRYLIYFNEETIALFGPVFMFYDLFTGKESVIDLTKRMPKPNNSDELIHVFEVLNDSSIVFDYQHNLYKYSFFNDSLEILNSLGNKIIYHMAVNQKKNEIAVIYEDDIKKEFTGEATSNYKLAFVDSAGLVIDTLIKFPNSLGNWSPDGEKLIMKDFAHNIILYDVHKIKAEYYKDDMGMKDRYFMGKFLTNDTLLLEIYYSDVNDYNLYYYDLKEKKIFKQITFEKLFKQDLTIYQNK